MADQSTIAIGLIDYEIVVGDTPLSKTENYYELIKRLQALGIERIAFDRGVEFRELEQLVLTVAHPERKAGDGAPGVTAADVTATLQALTRIKVGRITLDERVSTTSADVATIRRMYNDAVNVATRLWDTAEHEDMPDPNAATQLVDNLAQAVAQNRTALVATSGRSIRWAMAIRPRLTSFSAALP